MSRELTIFLLFMFNISGAKAVVDTTISGLDTTLIFKEYYKNNNLKSKSEYTNWKLNGQQLEYFESGKLKKLLFYKNDCPEDSVVEWFENGNIAFKGYYSECTNDGKAVKFSQKGDTLSFLEYVKGKPVGLHFTKYQNGQISSKCTYNNFGKKHGLEESWREDGTRKDSIIYHNGNIVELRTYFNNGKVRHWLKSTDTNSSKTEWGRYYDPDGKICGEIKKGNGTYILWSEDTKERWIQAYKNGEEVSSRKLAKDENPSWK